MTVSIDGYVAGPNGELDWIFAHFGPEMQQRVFQSLMNTDTILVGRQNYELMAAMWPHQQNPMADLMNNLPKLVFSSTLDKVEWANSRLAGTDIAGELKLLKDQSDKDLRVLGGAKIAQTLTQLGLIDQYELLTVPTVLGSGLPLFDQTVNLALVSSTVVDSAAVVNVYKPV